MGDRQIILTVVAAAMFLMTGGCAIPAKYQWADLPRYRPGEPAQVRVTSQPGLYVVAAQPRHNARPQAVRTTETYLDSGTRLGFFTDERGHLIAYTQHQQFDLGTPPSRLKYVQRTSRQLVEPEQVLFTLDDVADVAGQVGAAYAGAALDKVLDDAIRPKRSSKVEKRRYEQQRELELEQLGECR